MFLLIPIPKLAEIANEFKVPHAYLPENAHGVEEWPSHSNLDRSPDGLSAIAALEDADIVIVAIVGASGLAPTLSALEAGKNVVLANKESLVLGGDLVMRTAKENGALVIPADSEHNAVFQCIQGVKSEISILSSLPHLEDPSVSYPWKSSKMLRSNKL